MKKTLVENKVPDISSLVKKTDYNTKVSETAKKVTNLNHDKYITPPELNKLTVENLCCKFETSKCCKKNRF